MCRPGSSSLHNPPAGLDLPSLSGAPAACLLSLLSSRGWGPSGRPPPRYRASLSSSRKMQVVDPGYCSSWSWVTCFC
ncbi:hypothetical protein DAI22_06g156100 [Oryza sativa Japonica Group]|nr:hypothetical protein DAI22_06g156100 [Oryza sativa Japonica Group]